MPSCCRCNGSGRCNNCMCSKSGRLCTDCLPGRRGKCRNTQPPASEDRTSRSADPTVELIDAHEDHQMATHVSVSGTSDGNDYPQNADDNAETTNLLGEPSSSYSLPPFTEMQEPRFQWGACEGTHLGTRWIWHMQK